MIDPVIQQQIAETRQTKQRNAQLSAKYKRYLSKVLTELLDPSNPPTANTPSSSSTSLNQTYDTNGRIRRDTVASGTGGGGGGGGGGQRQQQQIFETPLLSRVDQIYKNQATLQNDQFNQHILGNLKELNLTAHNLNFRLNKTLDKLIKNNFISKHDRDGHHDEAQPLPPSHDNSNNNGDHDDESHLKITNLVQERVELLDQNIRILENCMKLIEHNQSRPIVKTKKGLFSL